MGLKGDRQSFYRHYREFDHPRTSERGGVLTVREASGIYWADYSVDPSGRSILGIKANDHEWIERCRQTDPGSLRRVDGYEGKALIIMEGEVITDWVHPDFADRIGIGDVAYAGPSGTLVNDDSYGGKKVGIFKSTVGAAHFGLNYHHSYNVLFEGGGLKYTWMNPDTHEVETINATQTLIPIAGWVLLRVQPEY